MNFSFLQLLPETKSLTLEELDTVFDVGNRAHASYYRNKLPWYMAKYVLRKDVPPSEPLYQFYDDDVPDAGLAKESPPVGEGVKETDKGEVKM